MSAPQLLGYSGDRAQFEKFASCVNERTRTDPSTARKLALDFSLVACGGRRCFMNDFAPNVTTDTLAALIEDAKAAYGPIAHGLIVVTLRSVDFVIQSRSWYQTKGQSTLVDASEKELLVRSSQDDETQNTLDAIFEDEIKKSVSKGELKVNLDAILDQSAYSEAQKRDTEDITAMVKSLSESSGRTAGEVAAYTLVAVISFALTAPTHLDGAGVYPATIPESDKELLKAITKHVEGYSEALENVLKKISEQVRAVNAIEALCLSAIPFTNRTGGARVLGISAQVLKMLYDLDVFAEEALFSWANGKRKELLAESDGDARFFSKAKPFIQWLSEASDEDESSEEE